MNALYVLWMVGLLVPATRAATYGDQDPAAAQSIASTQSSPDPTTTATSSSAPPPKRPEDTTTAALPTTTTLATTTTPPPPQPQKPFEVVGCSDGGVCNCNIIDGWNKKKEYDELRALQFSLSETEDQLILMDLTFLKERMDNLTDRIEAVKDKVQTHTVSINISELAVIKKNVEIMRDLIDELNVDQASQANIDSIKKELNELSIIVNDLWNQGIQEGTDELKAEIERLRTRLANSQDNVGRYNSTYFPGDKKAFDYDDPTWCQDHVFTGLGDAITHRWIDAYGAWFKDPKPAADVNKTQIFYRVYSSNHLHYYYRYSNYTNFISNKGREALLRTYCYGIGFIAYDGSVYCEYAGKLYRYPLTGNGQTTSSFSQKNIVYKDNTLPTYVDMKVDEYGLYAIYAENDGKLAISKINPGSLAIERTWRTSKFKSAVCAVFMACGKLYTIDVCNARLSGGERFTQYTYDTRTSKSEHIPLHVTSKYGAIMTLTYNPREKMLFGWDNKHLVTYTMVWEERKKAKTP